MGLFHGQLGQTDVLPLLFDFVLGSPSHQLVVMSSGAGQACLGALEGGTRLLDLAVVNRGTQVLEPGHRCRVTRPCRLHLLLRLVHVIFPRHRLQLVKSGHRCGVTGSRRLHRLLRLVHVLFSGRPQVLKPGHRCGVTGPRRLHRLLRLVHVLFPGRPQVLKPGYRCGVTGPRRLHRLLRLVEVILWRRSRQLGEALLRRCQPGIRRIPVGVGLDVNDVGVDQSVPIALVCARPILE